MAKKASAALTYRFSYSHISTAGKLENTIDALEYAETNTACLSLTDAGLEPAIPSRPSVTQRTAKVKAVAAKLRRKGIAAELIVPAALPKTPAAAGKHSYIKHLYTSAAQTGVRTIWVDNSTCRTGAKIDKRLLLNHFRIIKRTVTSVAPTTRLGLIAAPAATSGPCPVTATEIAVLLAGKHRPLLAQAQPFAQDGRRTDILEVIQTLSATIAHTAAHPDIELVGAINQGIVPSPFHKAAEATQMQLNLNILFGFDRILIDCFDQIGTAPGEENIYIQLWLKNKKFLNRLAALVKEHLPQPEVRIVDIEGTTTSPAGPNPWLAILNRMGIGAAVVAPASIGSDDSQTVYVLTGSTPKHLTKTQLKHVLAHGVLLDAFAAETIGRMGIPNPLGVKVGPTPADIQAEILSDGTFAQPVTGERTVLAGLFAPADFRGLTPQHPHTRAVTTLVCRAGLPNIPGIVISDHDQKDRRAVVLPYRVTAENCPALLTPTRQRHFRDLLAWLLRRRLTCFVENCPDLIPFYIPLTSRRIMLVLLNISYDWAIDARIRLARTPFPVKRVIEFDENGKLIAQPQLRLTRANDYTYIQLTPDTAVPPMQMTMLLLEG